MKQFFCTAGLLILLLFGLCGTGYALSVTLVKGAVPRLHTPATLADKPIGKPIILTFGNHRVVIHDTILSVPGRLLNNRELSLPELFLIGDHRVKSNGTGYETLYSYKGYRLAIVEDPGQLAADNRLTLWPVTRSEVVASKPKLRKAAPDPKVQKLIKLLSDTEYASYLGRLADPKKGLVTRFSCHDQAMQAAEVIRQEFKLLGLETEDNEFSYNVANCEGSCQVTTGSSVIGKKKGKDPNNDFFYVVGAHYDSVNEDSQGGKAPGCSEAPGANDNGSGVAGVLELARVFSKVETDATVIFIAFGGEELDLFGSKQYLNTLREKEITTKLKAFVVMDMISYAPSKEKERLYIEASNENTDLEERGKKFFDYAQTYTSLNPLPIGWKPKSSDHVPFLKEKIPGGLLMQMMCESTGKDKYPHLHSAEDTVGYQNSLFAVEILKVAVATLAEAGITFRPE
jgi:hypothetical protein